MRKLLEIKDHELINPHWEKMSPEQRQQIKTLLLELLVNEKNSALRNKIVDVINMVSENAFENEEKWEELILLTLNFISLELNDDNVSTIECGLSLLAGTFSFVYDEYLPKLEALVGLFRNFYKTNSLSLKTRTTRTISEMIAYCDKKETKLLAEFMFSVMETTLQCVSDTKQESNVNKY
jgi:Txe/YoeB family toxin of Txe-Axe toxin-antitoxin module